MLNLRILSQYHKNTDYQTITQVFQASPKFILAKYRLSPKFK